jgi:hypothetical protein
MTLFDYSTGDAIRDLTAVEIAEYVRFLSGDTTHTGATDGAPYGLPGITVYAI